MRLAALAALAALGCSGPVATPRVPAPGSGSGDEPNVVEPLTEVADAPTASEEERLAAIQKAMNELDEAAQGCWAAVAAAERFDIEGDVALMIDIAATKSQAQVVSDTARNPRLAACLVGLLQQYRWAPPLHGQSIQLPFQFRAPKHGQAVVDRRLVPWKQQGKVATRVLVDLANTGNDAASVLDVRIDAGGSTGPRLAERAELWVFHTAGAVRGAPVKAGDVVFVPAGAARQIDATGAPLEATLFVTPGGTEGAARAGALPMPDVPAGRKPTGTPLVLDASAAKSYPRGAGKVTILAEPAKLGGAKAFAASRLEMPAGMTIAEHVHARETELLYVVSGTGTLSMYGVQLDVSEHAMIQIPKNTKHAFTATTPVVAVQVYAPAGPEQRFKQ